MWLLCSKAFLAAWSAIDAAATPLACDVCVAGGGGGTGAGGVGVDRAGGGGGRGAEFAGGGGGGGGTGVEGFLLVTGGGGGFVDPGNGGGGRGGASGAVFVDEDLEIGLRGTFRRFATNGLTGGGGDSVDGGRGGGRVPGGLGAAGSFGADATGGFGRTLSESDRYGESRLAPVSTPPRLRNLGIPPAKRPPSCGADGTLALLSGPERPSLLLRSRFAAGTGGARPVGGFLKPGTGGAPPIGGPADLPPSLEIIGADLSLVIVFFKRVPLVMSDKSALYQDS